MILVSNHMLLQAIIHRITVELLSHFLRNAAKVAAPIATRVLDEKAACTKALMKAKHYNADKPDKFAIHFYVMVSSAFSYVHSMMELCCLPFSKCVIPGYMITCGHLILIKAVERHHGIIMCCKNAGEIEDAVFPFLQND